MGDKKKQFCRHLYPLEALVLKPPVANRERLISPVKFGDVLNGNHKRLGTSGGVMDGPKARKFYQCRPFRPRSDVEMFSKDPRSVSIRQLPD
jgi:hypothetical protein